MERLLFMPQPENPRPALSIDGSLLSMGKPWELRRADGTIRESIVLPVEVMQEIALRTDRRVFRIGAAQTEELIQEKQAIIGALQKQGIDASAFFTISEDSEWAKIADEMNLIRISAEGPVENVPGFSFEQSTVDLYSREGKALVICSQRKSDRIPQEKTLIHPDGMIPYTIEVINADTGETISVTIPTGATDMGMSSVADTCGRSHLFINSAIMEFAELNGLMPDAIRFLEALETEIGADAIHWIDPVDQSYGAPGILEWNDLLMAQNVSPEQSQMIETRTGKRILILPQTPAHHEAGYGLPRCLAGSISRENAGLLAKISETRSGVFSTARNYRKPAQVLTALADHFRTYR